MGMFLFLQQPCLLNSIYSLYVSKGIPPVFAAIVLEKPMDLGISFRQIGCGKKTSDTWWLSHWFVAGNGYTVWYAWYTFNHNHLPRENDD